MSTQSQSDGSPVIKCEAPDCEEHGLLRHFHHGKYCSDECTTRAEGRAALADYLYDHCICGTCFRELKLVEEPKPDWDFTANGHGWTIGEDGEQTLEFYDQTESRRASVGFQYTTEHARHGEKQRGDHVVTGTICRCGNTQHSAHDIDLADPEAIERLITEWLAPDEDISVDPNTLHREWIETHDLDLAVGRALLDDE